MKDSTGAAPAPDPSQSQIIPQEQQLPAQDTEHSESEEGYDFNLVDYLMSDKGIKRSRKSWAYLQKITKRLMRANHLIREDRCSLCSV